MTNLRDLGSGASYSRSRLPRPGRHATSARFEAQKGRSGHSRDEAGGWEEGSRHPEDLQTSAPFALFEGFEASLR